jgi:hypothetical protein
MFLFSQRHEFLVPKLHLLVLWKRGHIANDGCFFLDHFIHVLYEIHYFVTAALWLRKTPRVPTLHIDQPPIGVSPFRRSAKIP